jgi:hypothetical protein
MCRIVRMTRIGIFPAAALGFVIIVPTPAQIMVLDDFETGDFAVGGPQSFSQVLPEEHVLGGVRTVSLTMDSAAVSDGTLRMVRTGNSILRLRYGSFGDANEAEHLHFDAGPGGETTMDIEVPIVRRDPLTVYARSYSFTIEAGVPQHHYSSAVFSFYSHESLRKSIALGDFVGDADFRDIAGFELQLGEIDFLRGELEVSAATLTAIPEPGTYALVAGISLLAWAAIRSRKKQPEHDGMHRLRQTVD